MSEEQQPPELPWRKRHPVLSRSILYVLGACVVGGLVLLFLQRQAEDRRTRDESLLQELDALGVVLAADPTGDTVLRVLDEGFSAPDLPPRVRAHALRWRAMALRRKQDHQGVEAALQEAAGIAVSRQERAALQLEWAEARLEGGDAEGALDVLPNQRDTAGRPMGLLQVRLWAQARAHLGHPEESRRAPREALEPLTRPLPDRPTDFVGGRPWTRAQAATVLTEYLVQVDEESATWAWRRLMALAPDDFDAQVAAARGLAVLSRREDALRAWHRAQALDPDQAAALAASDPALAALR